MKKLIYLIFMFLLVPALASAQDKPELIYPGKGTIDINAGIGLAHNLSGSGGLPINLALDYGINDNVSVGGYLGFLSSEQTFAGGAWKYTNIIIGARGTYHHPLVDGIDTYGGAILGYNKVSAKWKGNTAAFGGASASGIVYNAFVGARYHFTDNLGAYGELGYGIAILQLGVTYRL